MFPLAVNKERLTPHGKFLLAGNNSVSGITVIATAAGAALARHVTRRRATVREPKAALSGVEPVWLSLPRNMVGTFAIAYVLPEDPRYFVENSGRFREVHSDKR